FVGAAPRLSGRCPPDDRRDAPRPLTDAGPPRPAHSSANRSDRLGDRWPRPRGRLQRRGPPVTRSHPDDPNASRAVRLPIVRRPRGARSVRRPGRRRARGPRDGDSVASAHRPLRPHAADRVLPHDSPPSGGRRVCALRADGDHRRDGAPPRGPGWSAHPRSGGRGKGLWPGVPWWPGRAMRKLPKKRFLEVAGRILRNKMAKEAIYPFYCSFKLTRRCNFTCSFCNCWHVKNRWKDMPTEDVKAVLDNLARSSVIVASFEGGDPLVRDDIEELLRYQYEKPWYLLFTTSERDMQARYPMPKYGKYIDFLHISIDEGHKNLDMYDELEEFTKWGSFVTVQCYVIKKKYPGVIISPDSYFNLITWDHGCDSSSIIVDADGFLWYPCRVLEEKTINLIDSDLMTYLESPDGHERRQRMAACDIQCAWYQYYATQAFVNPREILSAWMPYYRDLLNGGKQPMAVAPAFAPRSFEDLAHMQIL